MNETTSTNTISEWFAKNSFTLRNTAGEATNFLFNGNIPLIIYLCWTSWWVAGLLAHWHVEETHGSDHATTIFLIEVTILPGKTFPTWHRADWEKFQRTVKDKRLHFSWLTSTTKIDRAAENIESTLKKALDKVVPMLVPGRQRLRVWWTPEHAREYTELRWLHNLAHKDPNNTDLWRTLLTKCNHWRKSVRKPRVQFGRQHFTSSNQSIIWWKISHSQSSHMCGTLVIEGQTEF